MMRPPEEMPPDEPQPRGGVSRRSRGWLILTGFLLAIGIATLFSEGEPRNGRAAAVWTEGLDLQAHRAGRGLWPENTLAAVKNSLALGVTTLELDIGLTADGVPVALHDRSLNPDHTRRDGAWLDGAGPAVRDLTREELAAYDVGRLKPGSRDAERFAGQQPADGARVPALAEVFALAETLSDGAIRYNLETKIAPGAPDSVPPDTLVAALLGEIAAAGVAERTTIQSFDWRSLDLVEAEAPGIATAYLTVERDWFDNLQRGEPGASPWTAGLDLDDFQGSVPAAVAQAGGRVWSPYYRDLRPGAITEAHRLGLAVIPWTVNEPDVMVRLIDDGVDGLITDYPDRLRAVMAEKGLDLPPAFDRP
jgi:glycerophosphoryl diester phosphodiesterase